MNKQAGFSLVEIMIALLIGLFLMGGILQMFSASQQTYRMQSNLARLQENGRFALDFLAHDLRMAGYWGCLSGTNTDVTGEDNNTGVILVDNGTDSIAIKAAFTVPPILSCGTPVTTDPTYTLASSATAYKIYTLVPSPSPTLYKSFNGIWRPLIDGIQNMQILYGIDSDGDYAANYYVAAPALAPLSPDWNKVVSIRISLLVVTLDDNLTPQPIPYNYFVNNVPTNNIMPADRKIRRVFNTTIAIRNRLL